MYAVLICRNSWSILIYYFDIYMWLLQVNRNDSDLLLFLLYVFPSTSAIFRIHEGTCLFGSASRGKLFRGWNEPVWYLSSWPKLCPFWRPTVAQQSFKSRILFPIPILPRNAPFAGTSYAAIMIQTAICMEDIQGNCSKAHVFSCTMGQQGNDRSGIVSQL